MEENADRAPQTPPGPAPAAEPEERRRSLRHRSEYLVFRVGVVLSALWAAGLVLARVFDPEQGGALLKMTGLQLVGGRAAGILAAFDSGELSRTAIAVVSSAIEVLVVLVFYPLAVFSCEQLARARFFGGVLDAAVRTAHRHRPRVARYGIVGLLLFVWFPLWSTGPLVGAVIGYFLGMRVWLILSVVITGTVLAVISWVLLFEKLHAAAAGLSSVLPLLIVTVLVALAIALNLRTRLRGRRERREGESPPPAPGNAPPQDAEKPGAAEDA